MNLFKTFSLTWWQAGVFKVGLLSVGVMIGTYCHDIFAGYLLPILVIAVVSLAYVTFIWWKQ
jgi:hypothetical protein